MLPKIDCRAGMVAGTAAALVVALAIVLAVTQRGDRASPEPRSTEMGEARGGELTVAIAPAVAIRVTEARQPGRPIVLLDPGHGGRDPGARSVDGKLTESGLALLLAQELRERLKENGRVRVALTREGDQYVTLAERAAISRQLGADLFVSLHIDSAPNPLARGASVYSIADVASDEEAARMARAENGGRPVVAAASGTVEALLGDLALRDHMNASADLASRLVSKATSSVELRPEPHRFADFHVLRNVGAPAILFEAGYLSNVDDAALLATPEYRRRLVSALAQAIETDVAARHGR